MIEFGDRNISEGGQQKDIPRISLGYAERPYLQMTTYLVDRLNETGKFNLQITSEALGNRGIYSYLEDVDAQNIPLEAGDLRFARAEGVKMIADYIDEERIKKFDSSKTYTSKATFMEVYSTGNSEMTEWYEMNVQSIVGSLSGREDIVDTLGTFIVEQSNESFDAFVNSLRRPSDPRIIDLEQFPFIEDFIGNTYRDLYPEFLPVILQSNSLRLQSTLLNDYVGSYGFSLAMSQSFPGMGLREGEAAYNLVSPEENGMNDMLVAHLAEDDSVYLEALLQEVADPSMPSVNRLAKDAFFTIVEIFFDNFDMIPLNTVELHVKATKARLLEASSKAADPVISYVAEKYHL